MQLAFDFGTEPQTREPAAPRPPRGRRRTAKVAHPSLPGLELTRLDTLFFGLRVGQDVAARIDRIGREAARSHGLRGSLLGGSRYHVSLCGLGCYESPPRALVAAACAVAERFGAESFDVEFDKMMSFINPGSGGKLPLVLTGGAGLDALRAFRRDLRARLVAERMDRHDRAAFNPHLTLLYDRRVVAPFDVPPIRWRVSDLCLIHSLVGHSRHDVVGRWPLADCR